MEGPDSARPDARDKALRGTEEVHRQRIAEGSDLTAA